MTDVEADFSSAVHVSFVPRPSRFHGRRLLSRRSLEGCIYSTVTFNRWRRLVFDVSVRTVLVAKLDR